MHCEGNVAQRVRVQALELDCLPLNPHSNTQSAVILGKFLVFSKLQYPQLWDGGYRRTYFIGWPKGSTKVIHVKQSIQRIPVSNKCQLFVRKSPTEHPHLRSVGKESSPQRNRSRSCQRFRQNHLEKLKLRKIYEFQEAKNNWQCQVLPRGKERKGCQPTRIEAVGVFWKNSFRGAAGAGIRDNGCPIKNQISGLFCQLAWLMEGKKIIGNN